jgi:hypothetical protein
MFKDRIGVANIPEHLYNKIKHRSPTPIVVKPFQLNVTINGKTYSYVVSVGADKKR